MFGFSLKLRPSAVVATALLGSTLAGPAIASESVVVVASIRPVHSIVSAVMGDTGSPHLVMRDAVSHHGFTMRPSDAAVLQKARVVFLVDDTIESGLAAALDAMAPDADVVELTAATEGRVRRRVRESGGFEADPNHTHDEGHSHGDDDPDDAPAHGHSHSHADEDSYITYEEEGTGAFDLHIWLDPVNVEGMTHLIADTLSAATPDNFEAHEANARRFIRRLRGLTAELEFDLAGMKDRPFIVFHDGYQYFEKRFGLVAAGSAVVSPDRSPGAKRLREIRDKIQELGVVCVVTEPAFDQRLVNTITEGTQARAGAVDAMGVLIDPGPELYFTLLQNMAVAFNDCLAPSG